MITYRLADSLPAAVLNRISDEVRCVPVQRQEVEKRRRIERWLDQGHGSCALRQAAAAECVVKTWQRFAGERYDLMAWVVMPNHVHVLIWVYEGSPLGKIVQSWKSYTGRRRPSWGSALPGVVETRASLWMRAYWDRSIRNDRHFRAAVEYVHSNPVRARLVNNPKDWPWSSAPTWELALAGSEAVGPNQGAPLLTELSNLRWGTVCALSDRCALSTQIRVMIVSRAHNYYCRP